MLETIFTGHTIRMSDVVAIGPIQKTQKTLSLALAVRSLIIELHLKHGVLLQHCALTQEISCFGIERQQNEAWNQAIDKLEEERRMLVNCWSQGLCASPEKEAAYG